MCKGVPLGYAFQAGFGVWTFFLEVLLSNLGPGFVLIGDCMFLFLDLVW